jgi:nucleoside-diphosphate-sugar epimerase
MRIFVTGATGAVGRSLVPLLVSAGHSVVGVTRTPGKVEIIRRLGAEAFVVNALDAKAIHTAVALARPDVVVHEMTDLRAMDLRTFDRSFANTNCLRTEATDYLLSAARDAGVKLFVAQSFCGWPYARMGGAVKSETHPFDPDPPQELRHTLDAIRYLEDVVTAATEPAGVILRYGALYGCDTGIFDRAMVEHIRRRHVPLIGDANGWWSFLHVDDAAAATALAIENGRPGIYNIVDDDPAPVREWLPELADMLGAKPPIHVPAWLAQILAGEHLVALMTQSRAGSNAKARRELGWQPAHASWREGFAEIVEQQSHHRHAA